MKIIKCLFASILLFSSFLTLAEEVTDNLTPGYIDDDLFIYMHAGPGNNYRILGSINAGTEIQLTGKTENSYTQIVDNKSRSAWVESRYISTTPGIRTQIAQLQNQLDSRAESSEQTVDELNQAYSQIEQLNLETKQLESKVTELNLALAETKSKIKNQDTDLKKEYFYNGAIVLGIGLILGLVLPRLAGRRKSSMESWK